MKTNMLFDNIILGNGCIVSADPKKTGRNLNVLAIGGSGSGKTYSIVESTLMETKHPSLIVTDPKGRLIEKYRTYFEEKGYRVKILDFANPGTSPCGYDPVRMLSENTNILYDKLCNERIRKRYRITATDQDVMSLAHLMIRNDPNHKGKKHIDPFWDDTAEILLGSLLSLVLQWSDKGDHYLKNVIKFSDSFRYSQRPGESMLDRLFNKIHEISPESFACRQYNKIKQMSEKTLGSVFITLSSYLGRLNTEELYSFMGCEETVSPLELLENKTIVFVKCSDSDSTLYLLVNLFYTQMMQMLFKLKDQKKYADSLPVRFILDDFATNVVIPDMPRWISMMRERNISVMLLLQSITQLDSIYTPEDARTIISNCDNIVYLRSNDLQTAKEFSERLDIPAYDLLYMPIGTEYVFLAGQYPIQTTRYDIRKHPEYEKVYNRKENEKTEDAEERESA